MIAMLRELNYEWFN